MQSPLNYLLQYSTCALCFTILLAGCGAQQRTSKTPPKTPDAGLLGQWSNSYLKNKELVAQKRAIKQKMRDEIPTSNIRDMDYDQLALAKKYYLELEHYERAIKCLERMLTLTAHPTQLNMIRLQLADLFFELGDFKKASKLYVGYLEFYPGTDKREYIEYKAILSHFYITLSADRDQTETQATLALTHSFLENKGFYTTYLQDVQDIQNKCYEKLVGTEMQVCGFYLRRGNTKAAEQRLAYINDNYRRHVPAVEEQLLALETDLCTQKGIPAPDMPAHVQETVVLAQNSQKKSMVDRF